MHAEAISNLDHLTSNPPLHDKPDNKQAIWWSVMSGDHISEGTFYLQHDWCDSRQHVIDYRGPFY